MASQSFNWGSWNAIDTSLAINHGADDTSDAISLDNVAACEVSISVVYSNHAIAQGVMVYLCRDLDGTNYEGENDNPWGFEMPYAQNATRRRTFTVDPSRLGGFKLLLTYDGVASSTATVTTKYRTATVDSA